MQTHVHLNLWSWFYKCGCIKKKWIYLCCQRYLTERLMLWQHYSKSGMRRILLFTGDNFRVNCKKLVIQRHHRPLSGNNYFASPIFLRFKYSRWSWSNLKSLNIRFRCSRCIWRKSWWSPCGERFGLDIIRLSSSSHFCMRWIWI